MLSSGHRKADIMALDISPNYMKKTPAAYYCAMARSSKGNRSGKNNLMQFIEFHKFDKEPKWCQYRVLTDYLERVMYSFPEIADNNNRNSSTQEHCEQMGI